MNKYTLVVHLFNLRAHSREAKVHASLAYLNLLRSRLDEREKQLNEILHEIAHDRDRKRVIRKRQPLPVITVVGYTNAGKTSLIRLLKPLAIKQLSTHPSVRMANSPFHSTSLDPPDPLTSSTSQSAEEDDVTSTHPAAFLTPPRLFVSSHVFATLDLTHHLVRLPTPEERCSTSERLSSNSEVGSAGQIESKPSDFAVATDAAESAPGFHVILLDTIGFMADLPASLLPAFRATLRECLDTDLVLHVVDINEPEWPQKAAHVERLIWKPESSFPSDMPHSSQSKNKKITPYAPISYPAQTLSPPTSSSLSTSRPSPAPPSVDVIFSARTGNGLFNLIDLLEDRLVINADVCNTDCTSSVQSSLGFSQVSDNINGSRSTARQWHRRTLLVNQGSSAIQ
ncbi:unnamed protein product [Protopolystoma xenopodis]|uniref:Hflx-type G domain-containing protein n=1 Tax=Protopolystoma xenopodis TaxID=117903 RepID=A0A448W9P7_9PLAT|nr:unnamed protein product [Protopolystoma xenopodis]